MKIGHSKWQFTERSGATGTTSGAVSNQGSGVVSGWELAALVALHCTSSEDGRGWLEVASKLDNLLDHLKCLRQLLAQ